MTYSDPQDAVVAIVPSAGPLRQFGIATVVVAALALVGAFVPVSTVAAGVVALIGLLLGVLCMVRDPDFNLPALGGTLLSSVAMSSAAIMMFVYA